MTISRTKLRLLKATIREVHDAREALAGAQLNLRHLIAMTYLEDHAPMREIADAAGMSHQRVAQIVRAHTEAER